MGPTFSGFYERILSRTSVLTMICKCLQISNKAETAVQSYPSIGRTKCLAIMGNIKDEIWNIFPKTSETSLDFDPRGRPQPGR